MDLILREDVAKLGGRGELVSVKAGYARNFLLPRRLAMVATEANKKIVEQEREAYLRREAKVQSEAADLAKLLSGVSLTITQKAGDGGHLFGSVTSKDIAELLEKQNYTIDRKKIMLDEPIRQVGEYKIPLKLHRDVSLEIPLNVVAE